MVDSSGLLWLMAGHGFCGGWHEYGIVCFIYICPLINVNKSHNET